MLNVHQIIETDDNCEVLVNIAEAVTPPERVPLRLRGLQISLGSLLVGHDVVKAEWVRGEAALPPAAAYDWAVLAEHDMHQCARCRLWHEAKHRAGIPALSQDNDGEARTNDRVDLAGQVQALYQDYVQRWVDGDPNSVNPMQDGPSHPEKALAGADTKQLHQWLDVAKDYVDTRMCALCAEEDKREGARYEVACLTSLRSYEMKKAPLPDATPAERAGFVALEPLDARELRQEIESATADLHRRTGRLWVRLMAVTREIRGV